MHNVFTEYGDFLILFVQFIRSGGKATAHKTTAMSLAKNIFKLRFSLNND